MAKRASRRRGSAGNDTQQQIQSAIEEAGFDWQASDTASEDYGLGLAFHESELAQLAEAIKVANDVEGFGSSFSAPPAVDWRNNGGNWVTPVRNQSSCGSCVSFAACGQLESRIRIACRDADRDVDLSEAHVFFCGCGECCASGWFFTHALDFAKNTGVGRESDFPYTPNDQPCRSITPHIRITAWRRLMSTRERKSVLASKGPVMAGMRVYSDFSSYRSGVYRRTPGASFRGNHAVLVVGYSDPGGYWIVKNSWGTGWGENGYFRIAYDEQDVGLDSVYPFYDVDLTCPAAPVDTACRRYVPFLRQVLVAARRDARLRACLRYYICRRGRRPACSSREIRIVRYVIRILRNCRQYHDPFCRALG